MPFTRHHLVAFIVVLQFLVGANYVNSLDGGRHLKVYAQKPPSGQADEPEKPDVKRVLQNNQSMLWVAGGAILGAYVCTVMRKAFNFSEGPNTFGVAMATSIPLAAFTLHQYFDNRAEYCLLGGFLFALVSWALLEIVLALSARWKKTAANQGLSGLKDEVLGRNHINTEQPDIQQPQSKEQPKS